MVEHDTPPEEREPVLEEPHKQKGEEKEKEREEDEGESKALGEDQPSEAATATAGGDQSQAQPSYAGVSTFFSGIASMVQTTVSSEKISSIDHYSYIICFLQGKDFVSGGLDALENLGKKTMEVLTEGDPGELYQLTACPEIFQTWYYCAVCVGLREKRSMIGGGKAPTLSELLQEAKADSEGQAKSGEASSSEQTLLTYSRLFDEYKGTERTTLKCFNVDVCENLFSGVVHLEALDLLSKECESKVNNIEGWEWSRLKPPHPIKINS